MAVNRITISLDLSDCGDEFPAEGIYVIYKPLGTGIPYRTAGPFSVNPIVFDDTNDAADTKYEGYIYSACGGGNNGPNNPWTMATPPEENLLHFEQISVESDGTDRHDIIHVAGPANAEFTMTVTSFTGGGGTSSAAVGLTPIVGTGATFTGNTLGAGYKEYDLYIHFDGTNHIGFTLTITYGPAGIGTPNTYGIFL